MIAARRIHALLLMCGIVLSGCNSAPPEQNAAAPVAENMAQPVAKTPAAPAAAAIRALPDSEQMARAFGAAFGSAAPLVSKEGGSIATTAPARLLWQGDTAILITTTEIKNGCHACTGSLGVYYLVADGPGFKVVGKWPEAVAGNGFGGLPEWSVSDRFADHPVIVAEAGYTAQGCTSGGATLTELVPGKPVTSGLIRTNYANDSGFGDDQGDAITGKIAHIDKGRSFDVVYQGSRKFTEKWVRRGATFVRSGVKSGGDTAMPQC